jgi:chromosome segregation ATPase
MDLFQKQDALIKEKSNLTKQLEKLRAQLAGADEALQAKEQTLADDTLQQRAIDSQIDALAREKVKKGVIEQAIAQGQKRLVEIDGEFDHNRRLIVFGAFDGAARQARTDLISIVAELYLVAGHIQALQSKIDAINAGHEGLSMGNYDEHRPVEGLARMLRADNRPLDVKLAEIETSHPDIVKAARSIKLR